MDAALVSHRSLYCSHLFRLLCGSRLGIAKIQFCIKKLHSVPAVKIKHILRSLFYRSDIFRASLIFVTKLFKLRPSLGVGHLLLYREDAIGPIQQSEALFLFGLIRLIQPRLLVEFGFLQGQSAFNFLQAMPHDSKLYSFEIDQDCIRAASESFARDSRFHLVGKSQAEFQPQDISYELIDFLFFDGSHDYETNRSAFRRIIPSLAPSGIVAIHDTGAWNLELKTNIPASWATLDGGWLGKSEFVHQAGERRFVNHILTEYPDFSVLHFHSQRILRNGLTLLQRRHSLPIPEETGLVKGTQLNG